MAAVTHQRRGHSWWSSRRLVAAVLAIDVTGAGALTYALTRAPATPPHPPLATSVRRVAHPQDPLHMTLSATNTSRTTTAKPRPRPAPKRALPVPRTSDAHTSFALFAATQPGAVGMAIAPLGEGPVTVFGALQIGHAWSTMKVPVLVTLLAERQQSGHVLGAQARDDAARALEQSDNRAAGNLFAQLEQTHGGLIGASAAVQQTLRRAGDTTTVINTAPNSSGFTTWGQTEWSASGEVLFYRSLARGCLLSTANTDYVVSLMQNVEAGERWGAGSALLRGPAAFKGGWGPETSGGYLVRQSAIIGSGSHGYVFSMLALPGDGTYTTGTAMLDQTAAWVARTFNLMALAPDIGC